MLPIDLQILKYYFFEKPIYYFKLKKYIGSDKYYQIQSLLQTISFPTELTDQPLSEVPFTIFDLETTGLFPQIGHEVISIGAVQIEGTKHCRLERFHQLIKPIRPISKKTHDLTGITKEDMKNAKPFIHAFEEFLRFSKDSILVAHPATFDMFFLQTMLRRWNLPVYEPYVIDTFAIAKKLYPKLNPQLDSLIRLFSVQQLERHHALNDAIMTAEIFEKLLEDLMTKGIRTYNDLQRI